MSLFLFARLAQVFQIAIGNRAGLCCKESKLNAHVVSASRKAVLSLDKGLGLFSGKGWSVNFASSAQCSIIGVYIEKIVYLTPGVLKSRKLSGNILTHK